MNSVSRSGRLWGAGAAGAVSLAFVAGSTATAVQADTAPPTGTPATVAADPLPTWQVNGVVWSQALVGNTVYAVGNFTKARPPGTAAGSSKEVARRNILAYDITTGNLVTSFNHSLDGQGLRAVASPDGKRVYVGGEFTTVDGKEHKRLVAFDTATGKLVSSFKPVVSAKVRAITATRSTVYFGGNFFNVNGKGRTRLAAVKASDGSVLPWRPTADDNEVFAMTSSSDGQRVIVGGRFQSLNGAKHVGVGAVNGTTGASVTWKSTPTPARIGDKYSYVTDLINDGTSVYGANDGEGWHWFDGRWKAKLSDGSLEWLDNCYGATYGVAAVGKVLYSVSHAHDCSSLRAFKDTQPLTYHRALAETTYKTGTDPAEPSHNSTYTHQPVPSLLHWFPTLSPGTFTGQSQAAWAVVGNSKYIALGGEFPRVNGKAQQGLIRFAIRSVAKNKIGPNPAGLAAPVATASTTAGKVKVTWKATWDQDNAKLKYEVLRDSSTTPIYTKQINSAFWTLPSASFTDSGLKKGSKHTYKIRVTDPLGNKITSAASAPVTVR